MEVRVLPEPRPRASLAAVLRAEAAPAGGALLGLLLEPRGRLEVWRPADTEASPAAEDGAYTDFLWEEASPCGCRVLAVGRHGDLRLLQLEAEPARSLRSVAEATAARLLQPITDQDHGVKELRSLRLLSFCAGRCFLLLNRDWLLQLQWAGLQTEHHTVSCFKIQQEYEATDACVCRETLFTLSSTGIISVFSVSDGKKLATIDLVSYLNANLKEDSSSSSSSSSSFSSFCLLQVSHDLSVAVAVARSNAAIAVHLDDYFRKFPDHLLCAAPPPRPPLRHHGDEDGLQSSASSIAALGSEFSADRSWEARLSSMYSAAASSSSSSPSSSSSSSSSPSWFSSLPPPLSRSPRGASSVVFSVEDSFSPSLLSVSQFSAQLTFVAPGNRHATVALWDLESGGVRYHRTEGEAVPVKRRGETQLQLLLKNEGVFLVLFSVSQQDLLSRLMLFGSAATVDAVCHLNSWGRCSIPIHALQAGLKNRQLDTVEFYLKSKENILNPADQNTLSLSERVLELRPALDLLCSAVRESNSEAESRQFSEQLLYISMSFTHRHTHRLLTHTPGDPGVQQCVDVLGGYVVELRRFMRRFPWLPGGGGASGVEGEEDEWERRHTEEVVCESVLTNQMPRAQAVFRLRGNAEQQLCVLRGAGLLQVLAHLQRRRLHTATALLRNMGFSVKQQLLSICLYTDDAALRDFVVEQLSSWRCFSEEEEQSVAFIKEMKTMESTQRRQNSKTKHRGGQVLRGGWGGSGEGLLQEVMSQPEAGGGLWTGVRLDWVRNWNKTCKTRILLSRLQHTELPSCDVEVLWRYLTALHDQQAVGWVQGGGGAAGAPPWPEMNPQLVNDHTACSTYMKENILDLLARRGVFIPEELCDLERLLWRLSQGGGVMSGPPPSPQLCPPLGLDLHSLFMSFCLEQHLQYLLYSYLQHYRLTPRNCPLLAAQSVCVQPWFEMLVKIQEISRDLTDPALVFQASLTCAQVLLGGPPSLSSLLLEGHSLLALGGIMFSPGGVDQVVSQRSCRSELTFDPQLLKMALAPHPKLRAALFPAGPPADVSVYHLLQALPPLDPSRLFGWQTANTLSSTEWAELPHFSSAHLVDRYAVKEALHFLYFLQHGRPASAFAAFITQQLQGCRDTPLLLRLTWAQVCSVAVCSFRDCSVAAACVCFAELLGINSLTLRNTMKTLNTLKHSTHTLVSKGLRLVEAEPGAAEELIGCLEAAVADGLEEKGIHRSSYEASLEWALPVQFCQLHGLPLSSVYPSHCATDGHFIHFLFFVQMHNFPPQQVRSLVAQFAPPLQAHLSLAFQDLQVQGGGACGGLFQVLLQSEQEAEPHRFLLQEALLQRCPTLAVMATCPQGAELVSCLCVWLLTSVDDITAAEATAHLAAAPPLHRWTLHDLSIIWRTLLGRGLARPLLRGFRLFYRDCPLVLVLSMFELCCDFRNFSEAKKKLLDFQKTLITLRGGVPPPGAPPLPWVEAQASVLLLTLLQRCSSQFDLHRMLQLLAGVDKLLKSNGPDLRRLSALSVLLQGSGVCVSVRLLWCSSPSVQQEELQAAAAALQRAGRHTQARHVGLLGGLPQHPLLLTQLQQELTSQKSKRQWQRLAFRASFWRKCHEQLEAEEADAHSASRFFLSAAGVGGASVEAGGASVEGGGASEKLACNTPSNNSPSKTNDNDVGGASVKLGGASVDVGGASVDVGGASVNVGGASAELVEVQERCLLLCLAACWLSRLRPAPRGQLEDLEKRMWLGRVRQRLLTVAMETESVFNLPPPPLETSEYEALMKEFSFSNIKELNTEDCLNLEELPGPPEGSSGPLGGSSGALEGSSGPLGASSGTLGGSSGPLGGSSGALEGSSGPLGASSGTLGGSSGPLGGSSGALGGSSGPLGGSSGALKRSSGPLGGSSSGLPGPPGSSGPLGGSLGGSSGTLGGSLGSSRPLGVFSGTSGSLGGSLEGSSGPLGPIGGSLEGSSGPLGPLGGSLGSSEGLLGSLGPLGESDTPLGPQQSEVLAALVDQLLDEGSIHEAARVCRYFSLHHGDAWLALRCRGLASGQLQPETPQETPTTAEDQPQRSMTSSASISSLASFVILPLPEDNVAIQIQKMVDQCRHGNNYCKQVLSLYQLSKELQCCFVQLCSEDAAVLLQMFLQAGPPAGLRRAQAFLRARSLPAPAVAHILATAVLQKIQAAAHEPQHAEDRESLMELIKLCEEPNLVGVKLLENLNHIPLRDLSCMVELLVVAHDCFSVTCNMEGIVRVLQVARHLSHAHLAPGEHYGLLVRLLTGLGRYGDMTYVFDLLHRNHRFETLLRKRTETDRGQSSGLQWALLDFLKRCLPADSEKHNMVALCFSMRREIAENHEMAANTQLKMIHSQGWVVTPELKNSLAKVLGLLKDAAESFSKDSCVRQATRCVRTAKLVALQLHFLNLNSELRLLNLQPSEIQKTLTALPRCYQVFVVAEAYSYSPDWAVILYQKVILDGDFVYLEELKRHRPLTSSLFEEIFSKLDGAPSSVCANVKRLLAHCEDVYGRYKLAYQQNLFDVTKTLLQDAKTSSYLSDRLAS